jgi:hypothetical protein
MQAVEVAVLLVVQTLAVLVAQVVAVRVHLEVMLVLLTEPRTLAVAVAVWVIDHPVDRQAQADLVL